MMGVSMLFGRMKVIWLFVSIALFYSAWMTGFTFEYSECKKIISGWRQELQFFLG
jgi:hypothetical protein